MTTETGPDSEAKQPQQQESKETEKDKAKAASQSGSPQNQPEQLPAAVGHSTPARKQQVSLSNTTVCLIMFNKCTPLMLSKMTWEKVHIQ